MYTNTRVHKHPHAHLCPVPLCVLGPPINSRPPNSHPLGVSQWPHLAHMCMCTPHACPLPGARAWPLPSASLSVTLITRRIKSLAGNGPVGANDSPPPAWGFPPLHTHQLHQYTCVCNAHSHPSHGEGEAGEGAAPPASPSPLIHIPPTGERGPEVGTGLEAQTPRFPPALGGQRGLAGESGGLGARTPGFSPRRQDSCLPETPEMNLAQLGEMEAPVQDT